ncbi:MAG TPA: NADH:flavin oxidoreductase [Candidatus Dormibacteraeota bacterium]|nr:NADH:flavin oxidoreductase [Candidatus Dormibacteraeota bacterium]
MSTLPILRLGTVKNVGRFQEHVHSLGLTIPCDGEFATGADSPLRAPLERGGIKIGNRIAVQPMEGWDGTAEGKPSEHTFERWRKFGRSGGKLIWGGEAVAVSHEGRANPNQLVIGGHTKKDLGKLRATLIEEHVRTTGSREGLVVGLQLTHSGRYCRPNRHDKPEPKILYHHPILDRKLGLPSDYPVLTDGEIEGILEQFHSAAKIAEELGFDFIDIKHCHGYLGHEFLSAHTREGKFGGTLDNRTRFLREIVHTVRVIAPKLAIGVRLSAFDTVGYKPDPSKSANGKLGPGIPEEYAHLIPYRWGFGVNPENPTQPDLTETIQFLTLLEDLRISLVNLTAGSPYYNPHIQRPALYPPSDGYQPAEDPLISVARQMNVTRELKVRFPKLIVVGTAYSYLQDFLPNVAQAAVREGWVDLVGMGRMILTYPELLHDASEGKVLEHKRVCRTFSDCTTAPRKGLPSGCYPLDPYYKNSELAAKLKVMKAKQ